MLEEWGSAHNTVTSKGSVQKLLNNLWLDSESIATEACSQNMKSDVQKPFRDLIYWTIIIYSVIVWASITQSRRCVPKFKLSVLTFSNSMTWSSTIRRARWTSRKNVEIFQLQSMSNATRCVDQSLFWCILSDRDILLEQSVIFYLSGPILLAVHYGQPDSDLDGEPGSMMIFISSINIQLPTWPQTPNPKPQTLNALSL